MATKYTKPRKSEAEKAKDRHTQRKSWFIAEASRQANNRALMAKCENFYDSEQWDHEEAQDVRDRGQNPVVYNEVKPMVDWLIGTERRSRVDFVVMAEDEDPQADEDAKNKTKLLKYLDDTNRAEFERSYAAEDMFKAGLGWLEVGVRGDKNGPLVFIGYEPWRNILWDSQGDTRRDLTNARYLFRIKVVDLDIALALFPDKEKELNAVKQTGDQLQVFSEWLAGSGLISGLDAFNGISERRDFNTPSPVDLFNPRERVLLLECWSREPVRNDEAVRGLGDPVTFKMMCSIMTEQDTLIEAPSPYKHERFPFIPRWAYRNRRTGLPYGPIWPAIGPQEALNHRMSKSLLEASKNQLKIEIDAIDKEGMDIEEIREELNAPDGIAVFANGALSGGKVQERDDKGVAAKQIALAEQDMMSIRRMSSVNEENLGQRSAATSRVAMDAKAERGSVGTAELFDNLLMARQIEGELTLSLAEQFMLQPMTVRVAGEQGAQKFTKLNQQLPDGTIVNDIAARRSHFVVGEQAWKQSYAEAGFTSLMEVLTQLAASTPQVVIALLDVVFEMHPNLPRKKQVLERIRMVNGQQDPEGKMSPEQMAAMAQQKAMADAKFKADLAMLQAQVREAQAKGDKIDAEAVMKRLESLYLSAQAAQVLGAAPQITPIADELLASAGFADSGGSPGVIDAGALPAPAPMADPALAQGMPPDPSQQIPQPQLTDGALAGGMAGSQTMAADGAPIQGA